MMIPVVGSLPVLVLIVLIGVVFILCVTSRRVPREVFAQEQQQHRHLEAGHSYLYYRNHIGQLQYEEDGCRDCLAKRAEQLKQQGFEVTECMLGTKRSSDL